MPSSFQNQNLNEHFIKCWWLSAFLVLNYLLINISPGRKFEEIYPPEVAEFVYITDDTYTKKQVLRMEHLILKVLSFDLAAPTINQFLTQYFLHHQTDAKVESLSMVCKNY